MRTFSAFDGRPSTIEGRSQRKATKGHNNLPKKVKNSRAPRPFKSPDEIREKIANHKEEKAAKLAEKTQKANARKITPPTAKEIETKKAPMTAEQAEEKAKVIGDVRDNNPDKAETREKLKDALKMGSFSFSEKERSILGKILNKEE